jgi:hypothetical protein
MVQPASGSPSTTSVAVPWATRSPAPLLTRMLRLAVRRPRCNTSERAVRWSPTAAGRTKLTLRFEVVTSRPDRQKRPGEETDCVDQGGDQSAVSAAEVVAVLLRNRHLHHRVTITDLGQANIQSAQERDGVSRFEGRRLHKNSLVIRAPAIDLPTCRSPIQRRAGGQRQRRRPSLIPIWCVSNKCTSGGTSPRPALPQPDARQHDR